MTRTKILSLCAIACGGFVAIGALMSDQQNRPSPLHDYIQIPMLPADLPTSGDVQLVLYSPGNTQGLPVVSDQKALRAAAPNAYFLERRTRYQPEGALVFLSNGPPSGARLGAVYVNEVLIAEMNCRPGHCDQPAGETHGYAGLEAYVEYWTPMYEQLDTQADWQTRIQDIRANPDLAFFDREVPEPPLGLYSLSHYQRPN